MLTELEWSVFELIGLDISTRDIATLCGKSVPWVWRVRSKLSNELNLHGSNLLVTTAVKAVWIQEHDESHPHISQCYRKLNQRKTIP